MKGSTPLSPEVLQQAGSQLIVSVRFENEVKTATDVDLELHAELLIVKAATHHDLGKSYSCPVLVLRRLTVRCILLQKSSFRTQSK